MQRSTQPLPSPWWLLSSSREYGWTLGIGLVMALMFAHGVIPWLAASAATTTYDVTCTDVRTGETFQPKAIRFYWMGLGGGVDAASAAVHQRAGMGFAVSTSNRANVSVLDQDDAGTQVCENYNSTDAIATTLSGAGAVDGALDLNALSATGFQCIVDDQVPVNIDVFYEAWGGDGVQGAEILTISEPAGTGNVDYVCGFQPAVVFFATRLGTTTGTLQADSSNLALGVATGGDSWENIVAFGFSDNGSVTSDTRRRCKTGECICNMIAAGAATVNAQAVMTQWNVDGFRLNWSVRTTSNRKTMALAIGGGQWQAGALSIEGNSASATATVRGLPFQPCGLSLMGVSMAESSTNAASAENKMSLGTASSASSRRAQGTWDENGNATASEVDTVLEYDSCLAFPAADGTLAESLDINAWYNDGFQLIVDTAGGVTGEWIGYVACGGGAPVTFNNYMSVGVGDGMSTGDRIR